MNAVFIDGPMIGRIVPIPFVHTLHVVPKPQPPATVGGDSIPAAAVQVATTYYCFLYHTDRRVGLFSASLDYITEKFYGR